MRQVPPALRASEHMLPPLTFSQHVIQLEYGRDDGIPGRALESAKHLDGRALNLNHLVSDQNKTLLQSPTSSTVVEIGPAKCAYISHYFGEFAAPEASKARVDYCLEKLDALVPVLEAAKVVPMFIGVSVVVNVPAGGIDPKELKTAAVAALGLPGFLAESSGLPYDFSVRVAREITADDGSPYLFSNVSMNWYQTRTYSGPLVPVVREWEMQLAEEGLEFRYDRNNKAGLFAGRRQWGFSEYRRIAADTLRDSSETVGALYEEVKNKLGATT